MAAISQLTKDYKDDVRQVAAAVRKYPNRIIGFAHIDPYSPEACAEIDRAVRNLGIKGIKLHPAVDGFAIHDEIVYPVMERAQDLKVPVLTHAGWAGIGGGCVYAQPLDVLYLAELYPDASVIMAHMGQADNYWPSAIKAAKKADNIILDVSTFCIPHVIEKAVRDIGAERVIFGSDYPWTFQSLELPEIRLLRISAKEIIAPSAQDREGCLPERCLQLKGSWAWARHFSHLSAGGIFLRSSRCISAHDESGRPCGHDGVHSHHRAAA